MNTIENPEYRLCLLPSATWTLYYFDLFYRDCNLPEPLAHKKTATQNVHADDSAKVRYDSFNIEIKMIWSHHWSRWWNFEILMAPMVDLGKYEPKDLNTVKIKPK